jgi:hypothetical protein
MHWVILVGAVNEIKKINIGNGISDASGRGHGLC